MNVRHVSEVAVAAALGLAASVALSFALDPPHSPAASTTAVVPATAELVPAGTSSPAPAPAVEFAEMAVRDPLADAIAAVPSTGRPDSVASANLAALFRASAAPCDAEHECEPDAWTIAALAWVESGFRPWAVEGDRGVAGAGRGPGFGLLGLHAGYVPAGQDPFDPRDAVPAAALRLRKFARYHAEHCGPPATPHAVLVHWFCGFSVEGCEAGIVSAAEVLARKGRLRVSVALEAPGAPPTPEVSSRGGPGAHASD